MLHQSFESPYFQNLINFVKQAYQSGRCYPPGKLIFNAFDLCPPETTKVVIIGQDPYHGPDQAHGLSFSVPSGVKHPPSLVNIFKELEQDLKIPYPVSGDLTRGQNKECFTQRHTHGPSPPSWEPPRQRMGKFTDEVIHRLSDQYEGIVFLLWGSYAKQKQS